MRKTFVALALVSLIALVWASVAFATELPPSPVSDFDFGSPHAFVADSIGASLATAAMPGNIGMPGAAPTATIPTIPNFASILSLDSYRMLAASAQSLSLSVGLNQIDKRVLHATRIYAHILWSPATGSAAIDPCWVTAATQRTCAVQRTTIS